MNDFAATAGFGIGARVPRKEDPALLRGEGRYTDDLCLPRQLYASMVRSRYAHGVLRGIDIATARAMPGVQGVYVAADLDSSGIGAIVNNMRAVNRDGTPMRAPDRPALPRDRVRFVGEVVAFVVAETALQAKDAAECVEVDIDPLPAVVDVKTAQAATPIHPGWDDNLALDFHYGDSAKVQAAFAGAAHVVRQAIHNSRVVVCSMEPRVANAEYDAARDHWTLHSPSQGVFLLRGTVARDILHTDTTKLRVLTGSVGGSFGMKTHVYPEQICLLFAARALGRPVKWTNDRSESFLSDNQGRSCEVVAELALDAAGRFLASRLSLTADVGAHVIQPTSFTENQVKNFVGCYATGLTEISSRVMMTNKAPIAAYRGAGRPEANYYMNRLIDIAAEQIGVDRVELRRRNFIPPEAMPYRTPSGITYDSGQFDAVLQKALRLADWNGFPKRQAKSAAGHRLRGRGLCCYLESTGPQATEMGGIRFEPDGSVTMITGTLDYGQGHASCFAQVLVDRLGIPFDRITLLQGDSDQLIAGGGTGGSKSMMASGKALSVACDDVIRRGRSLAAELLEAAPADIEFVAGRFAIAGTDRGIDLMQMAEQAAGSLNSALKVETPPSAYPNGCHIAEIEVDAETGVVEVVSYVMVNDFGVVINPMMVEGQAHGGVVQGLGQMLCEAAVYDDEGQPLAGSFMDYCLPRATDAPPMVMDFHSVPATTNPLGVKGCGEAGCAGSMAAVMSAVIDALAPYGVKHIDMPVTPERVWRAMQAGA